MSVTYKVSEFEFSGWGQVSAKINNSYYTVVNWDPAYSSQPSYEFYVQIVTDYSCRIV
jgi:hypothetical protein